MGATSCSEEQFDREQDPKTIARRHELYNKYVAPFYNMIYKLVIQYSFSTQYVEENYNEVLVNFYRRIETYDPNRSIRTWLHIVTKRHVLALERKRQAEINKWNEDNDIEVFEDTIIDDRDTSCNVMSTSNYRELYNDDILSVLDEMRPIHRDALLLQEAGYSLKEIVEIEYQKGTLKSKNIDTVKSRLFLARQYLKKHLNRDGKRIFGETNDEDIYRDCE